MAPAAAAVAWAVCVYPRAARTRPARVSLRILRGLRLAFFPFPRNHPVIPLRPGLPGVPGQRLAGVVLLTDGRGTPAQPVADAVRAIKNFGVKVFPIAVGSDNAPTTVEVQAVNVQDSAFKDDLVSFKVLLR